MNTTLNQIEAQMDYEFTRTLNRLGTLSSLYARYYGKEVAEAINVLETAVWAERGEFYARVESRNAAEALCRRQGLRVENVAEPVLA